MATYADKAAKRKELLNIFCKLSKELGRAPSDYELRKAGAASSTWKDHFGSFRRFDKAARRYDAGSFAFVHVDDVRKSVPKRKRYLITTAVSGHPVFHAALSAIKQYQKHTKAQPLTLVCADPASNASHRTLARQGYYSVPVEVAEATRVIGGAQHLNDNLMLHTFLTSAKQIDPTTGTLDMAHKYGTCIFPSPKQRLRMVPTSTEYPRAVMTTGAITLPAYGSDRYMSARTAALAEVDHIMGAIIVEIDDAKRFHYRQIQFRDDGSFVDLGVLYHPVKKPRKVKVDIVFGDLHIDQEGLEHRKARYGLMKFFKPGHVILHDTLNGTTISHHDQKRIITRSQRETILEIELGEIRDELRDLAATGSKVVVVKSNHDEWLDRYLDEVRWARDPENFRFAHKLAGYLLDGCDPLAEYCALPEDQVIFLRRDESFILSGTELGFHGDAGPNGARGSPKNLSYSLGKAIVGHGHAPEIWRTLYRVGVCSMDMEWVKGPSSWCYTHCVLDEFGGRQLINIIDGEWRLKP